MDSERYYSTWEGARVKIVWKAISLYEDREAVIGFFDREEDAIRAIKKQGVDGVADGRYEKVPVFLSFEEFKTTQVNQIKKRAEEKLTEEEREVLRQTWKEDLITKLSGPPHQAPQQTS